MVGTKVLLLVALGAALATGAEATVRHGHAKRVHSRRVVTRAKTPAPRQVRRFVLPPPPPEPVRPPSRLGVVGQKYAAPQTRMSQAGLAWSLTERLSLLLSYERTAYAPTMSRDHDNGVLTGLRLAF
jgi:hypothetical protein